jgi:hypothetical protein
LLKDWYDGYTWDGQTKVYNPWSILHFFKKSEIQYYWMESGSTAFIEKLFKTGKTYFSLTEEVPAFTNADNAIGDIDKIKPEALLFQTGYLTVQSLIPGLSPKAYQLGLPNTEVAAAILPLINQFEPPKKTVVSIMLAIEIRDRLLRLDMEGLQKSFGDYLAQFTFDLHEATEKFYHFNFLMAMSTAGQPFDVQRHTSHGILDLWVKGKGDDDYIIEFKLFKEEKDSSGNYPVPPREPEERARLRERMATMADKAMKQIDEKYAPSLGRGPGRLIKVAMVIARRDFVLAQFEIVNRDPA